MTTIQDQAYNDFTPVPTPLSDHYDTRHPILEPRRSGPPDPSDPTDVVQLWGHCADFCNEIDDARTDGLTVTEHGLWCISRATAYTDGRDAESGRRLNLRATVVRPYLHGTYHRTAVWHRHPDTERVQLEITDGDDLVAVVNIEVGNALRLAAGLTRAAEVADGRDHDFNEAKSRRSRSMA